MRTFFARAWAIVQRICVFVVVVLAIAEGSSLLGIFWNDLIGRSYSIEFNNFPCTIYYVERASWFAPTRRFLLTPELVEDAEDNSDESKHWVSKLVEGSKLGESNPIFDANGGATFTIRPSIASNDDE
jgi:hypothetical protein